MSKLKIGVSLTVLATVVAAILMVPFPWSLEAPLFIEPLNVQHVYTTTPGRLVEMKVTPGAYVQQGELLARLANFEKEQEYLKLQRDAKVQKVEILIQRQLEDFAKERLAQEKLQTIEKQMADYVVQLQELELHAPISGTVVEPPRAPMPKIDKVMTTLPRWYGTALEARNLDATLEPRTHVLSIAPNEHYQAILVIDQADRNDLKLQGQVRIKLDDLPHRVFLGTVAEVSERHLEIAPQVLTNKAGGDLATVTDKEGRERLTSIAYQAKVVMNEDVKLLKSGMRGKARFLVEKRSLGDWIWRYIRQTLNFRV